MNGLHVSASSLRLLADCPRAFAYRYVAGHPAEDVGAALVLGRAMHAALALRFERLRDGDPEPTFDEMRAVAIASIEEARNGPTPISANDDDEDLVGEASRLLGACVASPLRPKRVIGVELPFVVDVGRHPVTGERFEFEESIAGVLDLVVEDDDGVMVIDHKVTKRMPAIDGGIDLQLALYALAVEELLDLDQPVRIAHHVITRTKVPRVELREVPRRPHDVAEALEAVASGVELIHAAIAHPRPIRLLGRHRSWRCGGCAHRRRCGEDRT